MEAHTGLVSGSHSRGQLTVVPTTHAERPVVQYGGDTCQICGDDVETSSDGGPFMACQECKFLVCKLCYEYERKQGNYACLQCKATYTSSTGSPDVKGAKEGDHGDDIDKELSALVRNGDKQQITEAMLQGHLSFGRGKDGTHREPQHSSGSSPDAPSCHTMFTPPLIGRGKKIHPLAFNSEPSTPGHSSRTTEHSGDLSSFGSGTVAWKERVRGWKIKQQRSEMMMTEDAGQCRDGSHKNESVEDDGFDSQDLPMDDLARQPLSRKVNIASSKINPYRMIIIVRLVVIGFFFRYRILNPVPNAYLLWLTSIICEIWFALSWILDQFPKWFPISRETYLDRLSLRYERDGEPSQLAGVDVFVSTVDPTKEPPLVTANTILSILAVDYPVEKFSCYVSDDGAAMLT
eukprot:c5439_g1_i1 orf=1-1212(-)